LLWVTLGLIATLLVVDAVIRALAVTTILPIFERKPPFGVKPASRPAEGEEVRFPTTDGLTLAGSLYRHKDRASLGTIIFCSELDGSHWAAMSYAAGLWNAGFDLFAFDCRNQGDSEAMPGYKPLHWLTEYEVDDALAAVDFVKQHPDLDATRLGAFGVSRGGGAALAIAARRPEVTCAACEGVFSTESLLTHYTVRWAALYIPVWMVDLIPVWHLRSTFVLVRWISQWRRNCRYTKLERLLARLRGRPILVIAGKQDTYVHPHVSLQIRDRIGSESAEFWLVPDARHNGARDVHPETYDQKLAEFFMRAFEHAPPARTQEVA